MKDSSPPVVCILPLFAAAWLQWPPPADGAAPSLSPTAAVPADAETEACENWPVLLSGELLSAVSPALEERSHDSGWAKRHAQSTKLAATQFDCPVGQL